MMKSHLLHHYMGGLLDTSVFCQLLPLHPHSVACQCLIPLLHPLLFLLLKLIGIQIVVFLRVIGDQELRYGFMLEIAGHDGIQEFALKNNIGLYIRKSGEVQPRVLWGLNPKKGALSQSATFQSLPDLLPTALDQMCRPWKHSGGTMHNTSVGGIKIQYPACL